MNIETLKGNYLTTPLLGLDSIFMHLDAEEDNSADALPCDQQDILQSNISMASSFMPRYQRTGA